MHDNSPHDKEDFAGYRWSYFSSLSDGPLRSRTQRFLESINWASLIQYASAKRNGLECRLLPDIGLGYNHLVRVVEFADHTRWVARLRMPSLTRNSDEAPKPWYIMESEYRMICVVQRESKIPVPRVHIFEADHDSSVGAPFMLMDCLRGNAGIDLSMNLPSEHKLAVYSRMAETQVCTVAALTRISIMLIFWLTYIDLFNIRLPKIGKVVGINEDGTYQQGPLPILGGPFDTAAEFFRAWASKAEFGLSKDRLRDAAGPYADEIFSSQLDFKEWVKDNADQLSFNNTGPFPLCHGDFGHNNIVFDDRYRVLGVIDWETAFAAPHEVAGEFPLSISVIPPAMDVPWNYDEAGCPKDPEVQQRFADRASYVAIVRQKEEEQGLTEGYTLSASLEDSQRQYLTLAMRLYQGGKAGWYSKLAEGFTKDR
ncbi:hypothetical protein BJX96DRAFT_184803 [Aspergillus floccosus]